MWQWLIEVVEKIEERALGEASARVTVRRAWREFGPEHDTRPAAKNWLKSCEEDPEQPPLEPDSRYRLAERVLLTRSITVIEGLDDDPAELFAPPARQGSEAPAPVLEQKRKRRTKAEIEADNAAAAAQGQGQGQAKQLDAVAPAAAVAPERIERAEDEVKLCAHCEEPLHGDVLKSDDSSTWHLRCFGDLSQELQLEIKRTGFSIFNSGIAAPRITVAAVAAEPSPPFDPDGPDGPIDPGPDSPAAQIPEEQGLPFDAAPAPAAALPESPADQLAAQLAADPTAPTVNLEGLTLEVFDGKAWYWQRYQLAATAEKMARKLGELIETAAPLGPVLLTMKSGRAPAPAQVA